MLIAGMPAYASAQDHIASISDIAYITAIHQIAAMIERVSNGAGDFLIASPALNVLPNWDVNRLAQIISGSRDAIRDSYDLLQRLTARAVDAAVALLPGGSPPAPQPSFLTANDLVSFKRDIDKLKTVVVAARPPEEIRRITERVIERIQPITEITKTINAETKIIDSASLARIDAALADLSSRISSNASRQTATVENISVGQRIDTLQNVTFTGTGNKFNLATADIPTNITAANYLPLVGGTLTGALTVNANQILNGVLTVSSFAATSTIATSTVATGGFAVGNNQFMVQQTSGNVGIGTTSPGTALGVNGVTVYGMTNATSTAIGNQAIAQNLLVSGNLQAGAAFSVTGTSTFTGIANTGFITTSGNLSVGSLLTAVSLSSSQATTTTLGITGSFLANVATSTITNLTVANFSLGSALTVANGGTGQTTFTPGNLLYGSATDGIKNVATSSVTCSTGISCAGFNVVGSGASTIINTLGYPFTPTSNFGLIMSATTTNLFATAGAGFYASSTSIFSTTTILGSLNAGTITATSGTSFLNALNLGAALAIANGGTNASSFITSGNAVYYTGSALATAPLTSAITIPYASSTVLSTTNSATFATAGGNVGIGTTTPNWLLQEAGARPFFTLSDTAAGANLKHWYLSSQGGNLYVGTTTDAYATTTGYQALTITNAGNVGIGTTNPTDLLTVYSSDTVASNIGSASLLRIRNSSTADNRATLRLQKADATSGEHYGDFRLSNAGTMEFAVGIDGGSLATIAMALKSNGNIGIGTTNPAGLLELSANTSINLYESAYGTGADGILRLRAARGTVAAPTAVVSGDLLGEYITQGYDGAAFRNVTDIAGTVDGTVSSGIVPGRLTFHTTNTSGTLTERMRIDSSGNVGIGTTSPMDKLSVVGNIAVTGCVRNAANGTLLTGSPACVDIAEAYTAGENMLPGDLVAVQPDSSLPDGFSIVKATSTSVVIGAVSSRPAVFLQGETAYFGGSHFNASSTYSRGAETPLALAGRVPVRVSLESGPIAIGDRIAVSSLAGIGMKATTSGMTVGIALENFDENSEGEWVDADATKNPAISAIRRNGGINQKAAETATFGGSQNDPSRPGLSPVYSIASQDNLSSASVDNLESAGAAGNRTPETPVTTRVSNHSSPSTESSYQNFPHRVKTGKILVFVNVGLWFPDDYFANLQSQAPSSASFSSAGFLETLKDALKTLGIMVEQGAVAVKNFAVETLTARNITTERLRVRKQIELQDEDTGSAYCIRIKNGALTAVPGECNAASSSPFLPKSQESSQPSSAPSSQPSSISQVSSTTPVASQNSFSTTSTTSALPQATEHATGTSTISGAVATTSKITP